MALSSPPAAGSRRRAHHPRLSLPAALLLLGGLFAFALLAPIPALPDAARAQVTARVEDKLPGWEIVRTDSSWEGAWTVVAACGEARLGFQLVPGHGLAPGDAWVRPEDSYSRSRLRTVSDNSDYLVWYDGHHGRRLSCRSELARPEDGPARGGVFD